MNEQQHQNYIEQLQGELDFEKTNNMQLHNATRSMLGVPSEDNLIKFQLEIKEELDKIAHILRGDLMVEDKNGNITWEENKNDNEKPFNNFGVQLIINVLTPYLSKNTLLSFYEEPEMFNPIIHNFGDDLSDLILERHFEMGMNTDEKIKFYPIICDIIIDSVHNAYRRALFGGERKSLREGRIVRQDETTGNKNQSMQPQKRSWLPWK